MQMTEIISPKAVRVLSGTTSKKRLFQEIGELAHELYKLDATQVVEALLERESLGPTGVGQGVALPHARIEDVTGVCGLFICLEKAVEFEAVDRQPVDIVFVLFAPESAGVEHLKALALVSRTLRDSGIRAKLRANHDPAKLHLILTDTTSTQAA